VFQKIGLGTYELIQQSTNESEVSSPISAASHSNDGSPEQDINESSSRLSFLNAAAHILGRESNARGLHYRAITDIALEENLIATSGLTPEATMSAQLGSEIARSTASGKPARFKKIGRGIYMLAGSISSTLEQEVERHNRLVRDQLLAAIRRKDPGEFEAIIAALLEKLGFEDVQKTSYSNDGGIDVFGNLVVGGVIRTRMAVQVKRLSSNIQRPTVQQVRGSLGVHDQGLIITTGGFSKGAIEEAQKPNAVRVALMDAEQLIQQLVEHGIGVEKTPVSILNLALDPVEPIEE
jgi:restriction system protein